MPAVHQAGVSSPAVTVSSPAVTVASPAVTVSSPAVTVSSPAETVSSPAPPSQAVARSLSLVLVASPLMGELSQDSFDIAPRGGGGADDAPVLRAGSVIAGRYRVEHTIGQGGMGMVLSATHLETGERVAVKVLHAAALQNKEAVARFEREARAAGKMNGAYTARILDVGTLESHAPYIVMEYLEGEDLAHILKRRGPLPIAEAVDYLAQACEALAGAHAAGIVHRDLKPGNLFLARVAGEARRGRAAAAHQESSTSASRRSATTSTTRPKSTLTTTQESVPRGLARVYMSPEQMAAPKKVLWSTRSDIWALGVTLYPPPHPPGAASAATPRWRCAAVILAGAQPRPVRQIRDDVPEALDQAILRCLAREPADRIQDVAALADAIAPFGTESAAVSARRARELLGAGGAPRCTEGPVLPPVDGSRDPDAVGAIHGPSPPPARSPPGPVRGRGPA